MCVLGGKYVARGKHVCYDGEVRVLRGKVCVCVCVRVCVCVCVCVLERGVCSEGKGVCACVKSWGSVCSEGKVCVLRGRYVF